MSLAQFVLIQKPWAKDITEIFDLLKTNPEGLTEKEVRKRQKIYGLNEPPHSQRPHPILQYLSYFLNPLIILLLVVSFLSYIFDNQTSAFIIFAMILASVSFTFFQERSAVDATDRLKKLVRNTANVTREGIKKEVPIKYLVPGEIINLSAGDMVPADCRIINSKDFFVNQSSLTGESIPVEKSSIVCSENADLIDQKNMIYFGTSVESGTAKAVVIATGKNTFLGKTFSKFNSIKVETSFDRMIKDHTHLMIKLVIVLVAIIFLINAILKGNILESLAFALAVAVGLTPEMLPAIITANLASGALRMSKKGVIVKHLPSIQNFGAMDILCTDKTGTLTEDKITLIKYLNLEEKNDERILTLAYVISYYQTGLVSSFDRAILAKGAIPGSQAVSNYQKQDEIPFDFVRRRMSVVVSFNNTNLLICKGSLESILSVCKKIKINSSEIEKTLEYEKKIEKIYRDLSSDGFRVIALATKEIKEKKPIYTQADEQDLCFEGFLAFFDPPKKTAKKSLLELQKRGIEIKIISGDNEYVNIKIAKEVGLNIKGVVNGKEIEQLTDEALAVVAEQNNIFVRISPIQKQRIISALKSKNHVVGYLGDGMNDALALRSADVGISVNSAVDITKEAADIVLLRKSLHVLYDGVDEGRKTFKNIEKYLKMGSSSNFGNTFSIVGSSILLPFLPMTSLQLLLNNFLYDLSQIGITLDNVDKEDLLNPTRFEVEKLKNFVLFIGPISSIFDYITFGFLYLYLNASDLLFRTGWFLESILTQVLIIYIIRTKKIPFLESNPNKYLVLISFIIIFLAFFLALGPFKSLFGFVDLPPIFLIALVIIVLSYLAITQLVKSYLIKKNLI